MNDLKHVLKFALCLSHSLKESMHDGTVDYSGMMGLWVGMLRLGKDGPRNILEKIDMIDEDQTRQLTAYLCVEYNIPLHKADEFFEAAIELTMGCMTLVKNFSSLNP
jgi:hypothetical protein